MRLLAALALAVLSACDEEGPERVELHDLVVTVPAGWEARTAFDGPKYTLTMTPPERDAACQIVVIRDGREFHARDAQALLGDGRAAFGGVPAGEVAVETPEGTLTGFAHTNPDALPSWRLRAQEGASRVEMVSGARGIRLVAAVYAATSDSGGAHRERCIEAVQRMR